MQPDTLARSLAGLSLARFRVTATTLEPTALPWYKGSTLRGAFGRAFRKVCCRPGREDCPDCLLRSTCPYARVFESGPPEGTDRFQYRAVPRPFVIEPPLETKVVHQPGDRLEFHLVLVGEAVGYLPYFVVALQEMGAAGVGYRLGGSGRGRLRLEGLDAVRPGGQTEPVYRSGDNLIRGGLWAHPAPAWWEEAGPGVRSGRLSLRFLTMTRLVSEERLQSQPEFPLLVRSLLRRVSVLAQCYCGHGLEIDYRAVVAAAEQVGLARDRTRWVDWTRYSARQQTAMQLGGIVGEADYEGPPEVLLAMWPLVALGVQLHVGKQPTFGLGRYEVVSA